MFASQQLLVGFSSEPRQGLSICLAHSLAQPGRLPFFATRLYCGDLSSAQAVSRLTQRLNASGVQVTLVQRLPRNTLLCVVDFPAPRLSA